jgi:hypothetical protein
VEYSLQPTHTSAKAGVNLIATLSLGRYLYVFRHAPIVFEATQSELEAIGPVRYQHPSATARQPPDGVAS